MSAHAVEAVVRSPWPDLPPATSDLSSHVLRHSPALGAHPALVDAPSGRTITYEALAGLVRRAAAGLAARGFRQGDVLALHAPNLPEYAPAVHAALSLGGTVTTANPLYTAGELGQQLTDSGARVLVTVPPSLAAAQEAAARARIDEVLVFGAAAGATPFGRLLEYGERFATPDIDPAGTAALLYSSGTTGTPKGVELSHRSLVTNIEQTAAAMNLTESDTTLAVAPFFHAMGFTLVMNMSLAAGATVVSLPRFELEAFLRTIEEQRVTTMIVAPPVVGALARHPAVERYDLSSLRFVACGAAPLPAELQERCEQRLGCLVAQGYGMTEASAAIAVSDLAQPARNAPGQVGILLPSTEARVIDVESGDSLEPGATGELLVRGPQLMNGYLGRPDATAATIDADGWLHTGDVGRVDELGRVFVTDRIKELIKHNGYQVAPAELEGLLCAHPDVRAAAVVGAPDERAGEIPVAFVVPAAELDDEELMGWVAARVAPHKRIRRIERLDEIPCSASGKILRRELRARI